MGKNGYLDRQKKAIEVYRKAERDTYVQFMRDTAFITLNDPAVMGKDVFGEKRLIRLELAWGDAVDRYYKALIRDPEADVAQEALDALLRKAFPHVGIEPFEKRYEWLKKQTY